MSIWSLWGGPPPEAQGQIAASSALGPLITSGVNTKGSWVQVTAGLTYPAAGIHLLFENFSGGSQRFAFDVGVGASGSEVVLLPDLLLHTTIPNSQFIPVAIPLGVPISVRAQTHVSSLTLRAGFQSIPATRGIVGLRRWAAVGVNVTGGSNTDGTAVDAGASANTLSAWVQLTASTPFPASVLFLMAAGVTESANTGSRALVDIGVGGSGSEVVILDRMYVVLSGANTGGWLIGPFPCEIPAGSRLSVRSQSNSTVVASARNMQFAALLGG